jgi:SAM-dependent methyltransferase
MTLASSFEDPARWENTIRYAQQEARNDKALAALLRSIYLQEDRREAFENFHISEIPDAISSFIVRFGVWKHSAICDLGCGPGHLAYALSKRRFENISAMDPNGEWNTGTGYLRSVANNRINIINDQKVWRSIRGKFDAIVSQATIHHWQHIPLVATDARRTMKPGAVWFAFSEHFANSPREFVNAINSHPTASRYGSYEWAYPPSAYVDLIQSVGFTLIAAIPYFYRNNEIIGSMREVPADIDPKKLTDDVDRSLLSGETVECFWNEVDMFRRQDHGNRIYTEPQVLVFRRTAV